jgi:glutathione peroxidase
MSRIISSIAQLLYPLRKQLIRVFKSGSMESKPSAEINNSIHQFRIPGIDGNEINLADYKGKKILLVNTASECGFTPQYAPLQILHEKYGDKLAVIGFPSNNFGAQEPGNENEIKDFCERNYGVTFPLSKKIDVTGEHQHPIFRWLTKKELNGWNDRDPNWNFCKYLLDENGSLIHFFSHKMDPMDDKIISSIEKPATPHP